MTRPSPRARLLVMGILGRTPFAGVAWQALQYLEGFQRLGFEVYYVEDTGAWPYDPEQNTITDDCRYTVGYIGQLMDRCGFGDRWAYRSAATGEAHGPCAAQLDRLIAEADALVNLTGATVLRAEHLRVPVRIYLETDPVLPQVEVAQGRSETIAMLDAHTHHFSYGENFGAPDCDVPIERYHYVLTRQPIVLDWWSTATPPSSATFTTIASWQQVGKDVEWNGERYAWSKHHEFLKMIDLPRRVDRPLEVALAGADPGALALLATNGWRVIDALELSRDIGPYRDYIRASAGEFTVAKDQNIRLRSGWFSDRSACYLAAGRPVITQDTGFDNIFPTGRGLFSFRTMEDVLAAFTAIEADYAGHAWAARELAGEYFAAERVLGALADQAGL